MLSSPAAPASAARTRTRFFADARFIIGLVLVIASVAGVWFVVSVGRTTVPVLVASRTIVPGDALTSGDLQTVEVALGAVADAYVRPGSVEGLIATRTIPAGELIPAAAVTAHAADTTAVVVRSSSALPQSIGVGSAVEVWSAPQTKRGMFGAAGVLVGSATISAIIAEDAVVGDGKTAVEIVIDRADVAAVLAANAAGDALSIVPLVPGSGAQG